uniref:C2H2-type domain-containing protein n=1 Tax=Meloidogyne hapla TaxID=6305 RepID=A0A1I8BPU7_MELHA
MSTVHHQKSRRVILCRCCNLAFRDKNELHKHLKNRNNDGTLSEDVLLPTIENNQPNSPQNYQNRQQNGINNEHEKESEKLINSKNSNKIQPTIETNNEDGNNTITSAFQLLQQQQQHFLLANLWNNILRQQTEQNSHENTKIDNGTFDQNEKFPSQHAASSSLKSTDNVNVFNCLNSSCSTSSNTCSSSSSSSSSVIVQTTKIAKTSITSPSIINSSSSSYISTPPTDSENDSILNNLHGNNDIKSQTSPSFSSIIYANSTTKCNTQRSEQTSTDSEQIQNCVQCALLKPKLLSVNERSNYLEACNTTFQVNSKIQKPEF